jgi:DNA-binding FadR family transcriptional regulator
VANEIHSLQREKLGDQVLKVVAGRIVNGELDAGDRAPSEQELCKQFGVSKTVSREVLQRLAMMGLVKVQHGRRPIVGQVTNWHHLDPILADVAVAPDVVRSLLLELHDVRILLEPEVAARAATRATPDEAERLVSLVALMVSQESEPEQYLETDIAFHDELAALCGNSLLRQFLESVQEVSRASRRVTNVVTKDALVEASSAHRRIAEAVVAGEPDAARDAMRAHLNWAIERFEQRESPAPGAPEEPTAPS